MKFTYQGKKFDMVGPQEWTTLEAIMVRAHTGRPTLELMRDLDSPDGLHACVLISLKRAGVDVEWDSLEVPYIDTVKSFEEAKPAAKARK